MTIRAVVFDLFDTLVDLRFEDLPSLEHGGRRLPAAARALHRAVERRAAVRFEGFVEALREVDRELRDVQYVEGREVSTADRFARVLARLGVGDAGLAAELTELHMGTLREVVSVPGHHRELLAGLSGRVRLGLCSNFTDSVTVLGVLEEAGLLAPLDAVAISEGVGYRKPRPEIFEAVLAELAVAPREVLHVGDNLAADVGGAGRLGMRTAWVTRRVPDAAERLRAHSGPLPDYQIRDLAEIPPLLAGGA